MKEALPSQGIGDAKIPHKVKQVLDTHDLEVLECEPGTTPTAQLAAARAPFD